MWFEKLMGFKETSYENVQNNIEFLGDKMISKINGKSYEFGKLEIPTLEEFRKQINIEDFEGILKLSEIAANVIFTAIFI